MSRPANQLVCNGCLAPIELGRSFTWVLGKPYHNHCANYTDLITRAEADKMVLAERERCAKECDRIAGNTNDFDRYTRRAAGMCAAAIRALKGK